jgi:hypothetical protein
LLVSAFACDASDVLFTTNVASDLARTKHTVSVLGVYRDGRMSMGGWDVLAPHVEAFLGPGPGSAHCEVGYESLESSNEALVSAVDEFARSDGPTDPLLSLLAPAAHGDLILVLTFAGKLAEPTSDGGPENATPVQSGRSSVPGGLRGGGSAALGSSPSDTPADLNHLEISASLFSVALGRTVALVAMQYLGRNNDEAAAKFGTKLQQSLPNMKCVGWNWGASIDPDRIRAKIKEED